MSMKYDPLLMETYGASSTEQYKSIMDELSESYDSLASRLYSKREEILFITGSFAFGSAGGALVAFGLNGLSEYVLDAGQIVEPSILIGWLGGSTAALAYREEFL